MTDGLNAKQVQQAVDDEFQFCLDNCEYFIENYVKIEDRDSPTLAADFKLWNDQKRALDIILNNKLTIALKARQIGITWLAIAYAVNKMLRGGYSVFALSKNEDDAKELVRRAAFILRHLYFGAHYKEVKSWQKFSFDDTALSVTVKNLDNGLESVFKAFPCSENAARSFTGNLIIFDEWGFHAYDKETFKAAFPAINRPNGGQFIGISTPKRGTLLEETWNGQDNGFAKIFIPWNADPRRDEVWYKRTLDAIGIDAMHSEYPATEEEAWTIPGGAYFPEIDDDIHITPIRHHYGCRWYIAFDYGLDMLSAGLFAVDRYGYAVMTDEIHKKGLIVSAAAVEIRKLAERAGDRIFAYIAPPDMWNRRNDTGRNAAEIFSSCGIQITRVSNSVDSGCKDLKEWLKPHDAIDEESGKPYTTAYLTFGEGCTESLRCLKKIQKDKENANVYAKKPHDLTHAVDMLRYFCSGRPIPSMPGMKPGETFDPYEAYGSLLTYGR